ncbi:hypothetical protein O181_061319, partial [Austropuccinia psidii MF-1]|nr:hypothetical protein [Austropuccinia psidii MF-1]
SENVVRQENIETASTVTRIIPENTVNSDHNSTIITAQNNQPEPITSEFINSDIRASYSPSSSSQKGHRRDYGRSQSVTEGQGAATSTRSLSGHLKSQPEGLLQCIEAQREPDPCRSVEKLHEFLPDCEKIPGTSQNLKVTQWMESIDGKEEHHAFKSRMEEKNPLPPKQVTKTAPVASRSNSSNPKDSAGFHGKCIPDGQRNDGITEKGGRQIKISEIISDIFNAIPELYEAINDIKSNVSDEDSSICNNIKTNSLSLSQKNETLMCFEKVLRKIKTPNNENSFANKINEQSTIIKDLTDKSFNFNIDDITETRIKQAINIIKADNKKVLHEI